MSNKKLFRKLNEAIAIGKIYDNIQITREEENNIIFEGLGLDISLDSNDFVLKRDIYE